MIIFIGMKAAAKKPLIERKRATELPSTQRSAVTNGRHIFMDVRSGNSAFHRRYRDLLHLHLSDLGGADHVSEAERSLTRRAVTLTCQLEVLESKFAANDGEATPQQLETYQRCANSLR